MLLEKQAYRRRSRVLIEDEGTDFPFYPGSSSPLSLWKWGVILASLVLAKLASDHLYPLGKIGLYIWYLLPTILLLGILAMVTSEHWKKLFKPVGKREFGLMFLTALYASGASGICAIIVKLLSMIGDEPEQLELADHPIETKIKAPEASNWLPVQYTVKFLINLMSEELMVILPFLAIFAVLIKFGVSRIWAMTSGMIVTSIMFGLLHLDVYSGDLAMCLLVIPVSRLVMTYAYIKTKNLWVTTGAHIIFDMWAIIVMFLGLPTLV